MERSLTSRVDVRPGLAGVWRLLLIVGASVALAAVVVAITRMGLFRVRSIEVEGTANVSRAQVVWLSGIDRHANAFWLDERAVERKLEQDPRILSADVEVSLPGTVEVMVQERPAVAAATQRTGFLLLAGDGTALRWSERSLGLPLVIVPAIPRNEGPTPSVEGPARALDALDPEVRATVRRAFVSDGALALVLEGGLRISYGAPESFAAKAHEIEEILAWASATGQPLRSIDVTAPSAPAIVPAG